MWKQTKDGLVPVTDNSRVAFRTNISKALLEELQTMADKNFTHVNYLLENGLENLMKQGIITYNKELRPKDRIQYKTTYDKELLDRTREFAKEQQLFINDVIEHSVPFIDLASLKKQSFRHRVE